MDDSKTPIFSNELNLQPASDRPSAVDQLPADLANSRTLVARERHPDSDQITPRQNDRSRSASTVVYCGSEQRVREGFLIALKAMGVAHQEPRNHSLGTRPRTVQQRNEVPRDSETKEAKVRHDRR